MIQKHCVTIDEIHLLINLQINNTNVVDNTDLPFRLVYKAWVSWETEIVCNLLFLSLVLERLQKQAGQEDVQRVLTSVCSLEEKTGYLFHLEGMDADFIDYMFRYARRNDVRIEEEIIEMQNNLNQFIYPKHM